VDWISLSTSAAAFVISTVCAAAGYRRTHRTIPREIAADRDAIALLREDSAALSIRLRALETAAARKKGPTNGP